MFMKASMSPIISSLCLVLIATCICIRPGVCHGNFHASCIRSEGEALLKFKSGLTDRSNRLASWAADGDCCQWIGVVCNNVTGHVVKLHLRTIPSKGVATRIYNESYRRIAFGGQINPSLLWLKHLRYLDLSNNDFGGIPIPKFLGSIGSLRYLNLSRANFGGMIPPQLGNLSNLIYLDLHNSDYDTVTYVESLHWLSSLSSLKSLFLSSVDLSRALDWLQVTNSLPSLEALDLSFCHLNDVYSFHNPNFSSLSVLDLSSNSFGKFPRWVFSLKNLIALSLRENSFQGAIPDAFQNMTSLRELRLGENGFNSSIPEWLYTFSRLEIVDLSSNSLQGKISSLLGNMTALTYLDLSMNDNLAGGIPASFKNLCSLRSFDLSHINLNQEINVIFKILSGCVSDGLEEFYLTKCKLSGHLNRLIGQFKNLAVLGLGGNSIVGSVPEAIGELTSVELLLLWDNKLNGSLPIGIGALKNLQYLSIGENFLEGEVFEIHFANLSNLRNFWARNNRLILRVNPSWVPPFQLIQSISIGSWTIGPEFPAWLHSLKHLQYLDMSRSKISSTIPIWFLNMSSTLTLINVSNNQIHGNIPFLSGDDSIFSAIDLSSNHFEGQLPQIYSNPVVLDLSNNSFSGSISDFLCYSKSEEKDIQVLDLGQNLLSGEIPDCWLKWKNLVAINLKNNNFSGDIPKSMATLTLLRSLNLHNNSLSGEIPTSFRNLEALHTLDLGENGLEGEVPTWLGDQISGIVILILRANNFHGHIHKELCFMTYLQVLDLADNNLSGTIPKCVMNFGSMVQKLYGFVNGDISFSPTNAKEVEFVETITIMKNGQMYEYSTILNFVRSVDVSNNKLSGTIPEEITALKALQSLNLSHNLLSGEIPNNIGAMKELQFLDFSMNHLSGEIPESISSLTFLSYLNLSNNELSGKIPSGTQIQGFDPSCFTGNNLCGLPLTTTCSLIAPVPNSKREQDGKGDDDGVDWFYFFVSIAPGFVVGFWGVMGPLMFNRRWRHLYFNFLGGLWDKVLVWFYVNVTNSNRFVRSHGL